MSHISKVELKRTASSVLVAHISEKGDFVLAGHDNLEAQDIGDAQGRYAGSVKYMRTVPAAYKDTMLLWLAKERFDSDAALEEWLEAQGIPAEFRNL